MAGAGGNRMRRRHTPDSSDSCRNVRPRLESYGRSSGDREAPTNSHNGSASRASETLVKAISDHTDLLLDILLHTDSNNPLYQRSVKQLVADCDDTSVSGNKALRPLFDHVLKKDGSGKKSAEVVDMLESEWVIRVASRLAQGVTSHATLTAFVRELLTAGQEVFGDAFNRHLHDNFLPELNGWAGAYRAAEGKERSRGRSRRAATPEVRCSESHTRPSVPASSTPDTHCSESRIQPSVPASSTTGTHRSESHAKPSMPVSSPPRTAAPSVQSAPLVVNQSLDINVPPPFVNAPSPPSIPRGPSIVQPEPQVKLESRETPSRPLAERITMAQDRRQSSPTLPPRGPEHGSARLVFVGLRVAGNIHAQEDMIRSALDDLLHTRNSVISASPKGGYWFAELQSDQLAQRAITRKVRIGNRNVPIDRYRLPGEQRYRVFQSNIPINLAPLLERTAISATASAFRGQDLQFSLQSQAESCKRDKKWILCFNTPPTKIDFSGFDVDILVDGGGGGGGGGAGGGGGGNRRRRTFFEPVTPAAGCPTCHGFDHVATACRWLYHVQPSAGTFPQYLMTVPDYVP